MLICSKIYFFPIIGYWMKNFILYTKISFNIKTLWLFYNDWSYIITNKCLQMPTVLNIFFFLVYRYKWYSTKLFYKDSIFQMHTFYAYYIIRFGMIKSLIKESCGVGGHMIFLLKICIKGILLLKSEYCYSYKKIYFTK